MDISKCAITKNTKNTKPPSKKMAARQYKRKRVHKSDANRTTAPEKCCNYTIDIQLLGQINLPQPTHTHTQQLS